MAKDEQVEEEIQASPSRKRSVIIGLIILLIIATAGCSYWFWKYHKAVTNTPDARQKQYVAQLDKIVVTPSEQPVITTVVDASKLTNKKLASEAKNGDQLFIFSNAHRIILYRPAEHKVVDMLTITAK